MEFINSTASLLHEYAYDTRSYSFLNGNFNEIQTLYRSNSDSFGFNSILKYENNILNQCSLPPLNSSFYSTDSQGSGSQSSYYIATQLSGSYNSRLEDLTNNTDNQDVYESGSQDEYQYFESQNSTDEDYENDYEQIKQELEQQYQLNQLKQHQLQSNINSKYAIMIPDDDEDYNQDQLNNDNYIDYYLHIL